MRIGAKDNWCSFITVVSVCFSLSEFVFPIPVYAVGEVAVWGSNWHGECNVPELNTGFKAVAAGGLHSLGLKQDGSIVAWGNNDFDQCLLPSPNTGFTAISTEGYHSLGLKQNGSIVAWGDNFYGQCDVPEPNTGFLAIAASGDHSLGLKGCPYNLAGDLSNDCKVDFYDLAVLANSWLADYDMYDLQTLATDWLIDCFEEPSNPACVRK